MLNFKEFLTETNDKFYPIRLMFFDEDRVRYSFVTEDGRRGSINFEADYDPDNQSQTYMWDMDFTVNGLMSVTGEGDAFRIFATVIKAMEHFYKKKKDFIRGIEFIAVALGGGKESRIKLYRRMLNKFARIYDFRVEESSTVSGIKFNLYLI